MFFRLIEMIAQRFLGNFLQIGVDRRVNAKALIHRAVPADGRDDLLPNVINRVGLSARALAIAGHDRFSLRARAFFGVDETNVVHPIENKVARVARSIPISSRAKVCSVI